MWDLPGPGLEPVSPALAGGFLTTAPPGKFPVYFLEFSASCFMHSVHGFHLYSVGEPGWSVLTPPLQDWSHSYFITETKPKVTACIKIILIK